MKEERINTYWSDFFGIKKEELSKTGALIVPHNYLGDYEGAWIFKQKNSIIISVPIKLVNPITNKIKEIEINQDNPFSTSFLKHLFGKSIDKIIGPVYQGFYNTINDYCNEKDFQVSENVKRVNYNDHQELITKLSKSGDQEGWSHSGINKDNDGLVGYFYKDQIESIACYNIIKGDLAFVGVYTNPNFRGRGFSQDVLKKMVNDLSASGKLIRYQTLLSNKASIKLADKVGFIKYGINIAIRLKINLILDLENE